MKQIVDVIAESLEGFDGGGTCKTCQGDNLTEKHSQKAEIGPNVAVSCTTSTNTPKRFFTANTEMGPRFLVDQRH